jgi:hypothetical protein
MTLYAYIFVFLENSRFRETWGARGVLPVRCFSMVFHRKGSATPTNGGVADQPGYAANAEQAVKPWELLGRRVSSDHGRVVLLYN